MDIASTTAVKTLFSAHGIRPNKSLGQNFLVHPQPIHILIHAGNIQNTDTVVEIGPGIGALTQQLAQRAGRVIAIEKDKAMVEMLRDTLAAYQNVEVIHADALKTDYTRYHPPAGGQNTRYKVVANLPYYITAPVIRMFLEQERQPASLTLIVQKEVGQRICALPPNMSILAASVRFYATATRIAPVKKTAFWPQPHVDSVIIHLTPHTALPTISPAQFFRVLKAGFSQPRRQLANNLTSGLHLQKERVTTVLQKHGIQPTQRAETLSVQDWINLANDL